MRHSDRGKIGRLHAGESSIEEATLPAADPDLDKLRMLRVLDERIEDAGHPALLDAIDRQIVDAGLCAGRIDYAAIAATLGVHRSTVWRRVKRLIDREPVLYVRGATLLGERRAGPITDPEEPDWKRFIAMAKTYAWGGVGDRPAGALDIDNFNKVAAIHAAGYDARRELNPPPDLSIERRGGKLFVTASGPLPSNLQEAVRTRWPLASCSSRPPKR